MTKNAVAGSGLATELVLHERTRQDVAGFARQPSHSLLLIGPAGSGKPTLARSLIAAILDLPAEKLSTHPYFLHISPEKNSISIDAIRQAQAFVRLRTTGTKPFRRAVLVEDAHLLTTEAQNAFLKLLEEPPEDTVIILTAEGHSSLLPTIVSRTPKITVKTPAQPAIAGHFEQAGFANADITKSYHVSRGRPGLMHNLLQTEADNQRLEYIEDAKRLLQADSFNRLILIDQFTKQKKDLSQLLWALQRVSDAALRQAAQKAATAQVTRWQKDLKAILAAQDSLSANPQPKLLLTNLSLQL